MTNKEAVFELNMMKRMVKADSLADEALDLAIKALEDRPTGHWVVDEEHSITMTFYKCTNCNYFGGATHYLFCPRCGADMRNKEAHNE